MASNLDIVTGAKGVGSSTLKDFEESGFKSAEEVGNCTPEELSEQVNGVGYSTAISVLKFLEGEGYRDTSNRDDDLERLIELLQDLFEFDNKDRDFGIYKLMNANREKIEQYIKKDLIDKIEDEVARLHDRFGGSDEEEIKEEVLSKLGSDAWDGNALSQEALDEIETRSTGPSESELENIRSEIYNHIYQFLSNYYDSGDFITQRKRTNRSAPYSVPYDGSNTHFHWVTKNQYYSKTSENFTTFTFNTGNYRICFKTVEDELDGSGVGNDQYFVMADNSEIEITEDSIVVPFYRRMIGNDDLDKFDISSSTHNKQSAMNDKFSEMLIDYLSGQGVNISKDKISNRVNEYTTRNQNDFFIHKNIESFLTEELEEYVKSEIFTYDPDSGAESLSDLSMEKGRIVNDIVKDIISFVSQLEEFKRKIFEKKKFVKNSEKLVQVRNIPDKNYGLLLENNDQLSEWEESFDIDCSQLEQETLSEYPHSHMMVDTQYFDVDITKGQELQNKLIKGDNYQALQFLEEKYKNSVKAIYIDPPYNTGNANFAYKDKYQRPTWLSMMYDRLRLSYELLAEDGCIFMNLDENEVENGIKLLNSVFGENNRIATLIWRGKGGGQDNSHLNTTHEYILFYAKDSDNFDAGEKIKENVSYGYYDEDKELRYDRQLLRKWGSESKREDRPNMYYPIEAPDGEEVYPILPNGNDGRWRWKKESTEKAIKNGELEFVKDDGEWTVYQKKYEPEDGEETMKYPTIISEEVGRTSEGTTELKHIFGYGAYDHPKPKSLIEELFRIGNISGRDIVLDFFAGSGTTGQAVQELNQENDEQVNYILVEMLDKAFDITKDRVKRTAYVREWKGGKPQVTQEYAENHNDKSSFDAEYIELESYEEALDAIEFDDTQKTINRFDDSTLNYLLEFGTKNSPVFLDTERLSNPLDYKLSGSISSYNVNVMTTFNYLLGLEKWNKTKDSIDNIDYDIYEGKVNEEEVLVIWRSDDNVSYQKEQDMFDYEKYDRVYINGDSSIPNSQPISSTFKREMMPDMGDML